MPSKTKRAATKRASLPLRVDYDRAFVKDWRRLNESGRFDMNRLKHLMGLIAANEGPLPPEFKDHPLLGAWKDHRDCHVHGDHVLIYRIDPPANLVVFVRTGTHADLFEG